MVSKLNSTEQGGSGSKDGFAIPIQESKRRHRACKGLLGRLSYEEILAALVPVVKKVVKEELDRALNPAFYPSPRSFQTSIGSSGTSSFQLNFVNKLPKRIFTNSKLQAEDNVPLQIELVDSRSMSRITSGPLSSLKVEIFVVNGDFAADEESEWTENDLNPYKVRAREGRRPLLAGDQVVTLVNGVGWIKEISFTDNSSWTRSRKFRLVAKTKQRSNTDYIRIREAVTNAVMVKDHRGELNQKHHPPSLSDDVWRLEKIGKDGKFHTRLASHHIHTVREFLRRLVMNPTELRKIIGRLSNNTWEKIINHANSRNLDDYTLYMYNMSLQVLVLNAIYEPVGVSFDGHNFQALDNLSSSQKNLVEDLKRHAYKNIDQLSIIEEPSMLDSLWSLNREADPSVNPSVASEIHHLHINLQGQQDLHLGLDHSALSTAAYEIASQTEVPEAQTMQAFSPLLSNSFLMRSFSFGLSPVTDHSSLNDISLVQSSWYPYSMGMNDFFGASSSEAQFGMLSSHPTHGFCITASVKSNSKAGWCKIRAAVKWKILARQVVAARRMAVTHLGHFF